MKTKYKLLTATGIASLIASVSVTVASGEEVVKCVGGNSCHGQGACKSQDQSVCAGKNTCKGKGWVKIDKKTCLKRGGQPKLMK